MSTGYDVSKDKVVGEAEMTMPGKDWNGNPQGLTLRLVSYDGGPIKLDISKWYVDPKSLQRTNGRVNRMECDPAALRSASDALLKLATSLEILGTKK